MTTQIAEKTDSNKNSNGRNPSHGSSLTISQTVKKFGWNSRSLQDTGDGSVCMMGALCKIFEQEYEELDLESSQVREHIRALYDSRLDGTTRSPEDMAPERMVDVIIDHNDLGVTFEQDARAWARRADCLIKKREKDRGRGHRLVKAAPGSYDYRTPARWNLVCGAREIAQVSGRKSGHRNLWYFSPRGSSRTEGPYTSRKEAVQAALTETSQAPENLASYSRSPRKK